MMETLKVAAVIALVLLALPVVLVTAALMGVLWVIAALISLVE